MEKTSIPRRSPALCRTYEQEEGRTTMLQEAALRALKTVLPDKQIFADRTSLIVYEADAGLDKGTPEVVAFPRSAEEVERIVNWASKYGVPLIGRGAGTGLSGGAIADRGGVIVEFQHMNHLLELDVEGRSVIAEPALINLHLDERARQHGLYFPPDPSSQRASTIGGNVAENSGGPHCFKYGVTTNYIAGLEVVLADDPHGQRVRRVRLGGRANDYPAYDLCGLFTGSEGTLGLITSVTARLVRNPPAVKTLLAIFDSVEQAGRAVSAVIAAGLVSATMEMMDRQMIRIAEPFAQAGLPLDAGAMLIVEVDGYPASLDDQMEEIVSILKAHGGTGMRVAHNEEERYKIWLARKSVAGAVSRIAPAFYIVDVTVLRSRLAEMLAIADEICVRYDLPSGHVFHAGDGNLHPNILITNPEDPALMERVLAAGHEIARRSIEMGGSITGEHGVGTEKRQFMPLMHNTAELMTHWDVKEVFDPQNIFNPGKMFPVPAEGEPGPFAGYAPGYRNVTLDEHAVLPSEVFRPRTAEEAAQGLSALSEAGRCVYINKPAKRPQATRLDTSELSGIKTYAPDDLYITVGAGTQLSAVQDFLHKDGKQLPLASPWPAATIGGIVAANHNAPLRMRYGAIRDLTLCATVALPCGRLIRTGRPIVKNVAGYDLTRGFIGSQGTLGLLTDVSLKVVALPRAQRTLLIPVEDIRRGLRWGRQLLPLALTASAVLLSKGYYNDSVPESPYLLAYAAEGHPQDVQAELAQVREALRAVNAPEPAEVEAFSGTQIWTDLLHRSVSKNLVVRAGVPVRDLPAYVQNLSPYLEQGSFIVDFAAGFVYTLGPSGDDAEAARAWLERLRSPALALEGYAIAMDVPETLQGHLDPWGYRPASLEIMQRLKARWDPNGILNPGEFLFA
ncbi:MAG: FAD-binding protein [Ktedonobacteraceae bacterium]|nr:FAD-binding protein [Ktedonobacteraceae bacterium]